jgi:hypothetical protein
MRREKHERSKAAAVAACRLHWRIAEQCNHDVVKALALRHELDAVCCVDYVSLFTDFFEYLKRLWIWEKLAALVPENKKRFLIDTLPYLLIYIETLVAELPSMNAAEEVLLTNEAAMRAVGFNAYQVKEGICRRGRHRRKDGGPPGRPVAADTVGGDVGTIGREAVADLFNHAVQMLAAQGVFPKEVTVALDPTDIETPKGFEGAGSVTRKKKARDGTFTDGAVFLTNLPVKNALRVYDLYDERSLIETPLNKEAKQNWHLNKPPKRTAHAMHNHVLMVLMLMGLTRAYRQYQADLEADPNEKNPAADPLGFRRWRRQVERENADKVIVFVDDKFAILHLAEFTVLVSDIRIRGSTTRDMVLAKYGVAL